MKAGSLSLDEVARLWVESGGGAVPVSGRSMRPTFEDASTVRMEPAARIRFGDVLVYTNGSFLVVHRVVAVHRGPLYRTKGDGLPHLDPALVPHARILGRVVEFERVGRRYRTDTRGGRVYARLAGGVSALEGFLYRFAYRIDRFLTRVRGVRSGAHPRGETEAPSREPLEARRGKVAPSREGLESQASRSDPASRGQQKGTGRAPGVTLVRRTLRAGGRMAVGLLDRLLFPALHRTSP